MKRFAILAMAISVPLHAASMQDVWKAEVGRPINVLGLDGPTRGNLSEVGADFMCVEFTSPTFTLTRCIPFSAIQVFNTKGSGENKNSITVAQP